MNDRNRNKTATAPAVAVLAVDARFHDHVPALLPYNPGLKDVLDADPGIRDGMGRFNAALQVGYFLLAVRAVGLTAGPMAGFDRPGVDAEFFPDGRFSSLLVVNIGHPGENPWFDRLPRLPHADSVQWT
jgi:3-hydroxypropanoate dehydrogenase